MVIYDLTYQYLNIYKLKKKIYVDNGKFGNMGSTNKTVIHIH